MGNLGFQRPVGAAADIAELEYISALHQTDMPHLRSDGSIKDSDIVHFLSSRYGIKVTEEEVRKTVMYGLGGGDDDEDCIDLMELVAILLIPTLIKAAEAVDNHDGFDAEEGGHAGISGNDNNDSNAPQRDLDRTRREPLQPHPGLLNFALSMILHDVTGDKNPKPITCELVRDIFLSYGETELAQDSELLHEMVEAAGGTPSQQGGAEVSEGQQQNDASVEPVLLDTDAFAHALTGDVRLYDVANEVKLTTNYFDVFHTYQSSHKVDILRDLEHNNDTGKDIDTQRAERRPVKKKWTASAIDMAAGTFRSKPLVVLLWVTMVISYFAYFYDDFSSSEFYNECPGWDGETGGGTAEAMACRVFVSIGRWLAIFFTAGMYGLAFVGIGSLGNAIERQGRCALILPWVGILAVLATIWSNFNDERSTNADAEDNLLYLATLVLGGAIIVLKLVDFASLCIPRLTLQARPLLSRLLTPKTLIAESSLKQSAAFKMNKLVKHALDIQQVTEKESVVDTHYGQALLAFAKLGDKYESVGGFKWAWAEIYSGDLFHKEGIWLSARLLAGNTSMIIVAIWVLISGITLTQRISREFGANETEDTIAAAINAVFPEITIDSELLDTTVNDSSLLVSSYLQESNKCSSILSQMRTNTSSINGVDAYEFCAGLRSNPTLALRDAGFDVESLEKVVYESMYSVAEASANQFYPSEKYMVMAPLIVATIVAFLSALALTLVYIPSVTSTTLQLRSGVIPTFRNPRFDIYRFGADLVTVLLGSMFWGSLASSLLVGGFVGCVVFFFLWQVTEVWAFRFIAFLVGIIVIAIIRVLLIVWFRGKFFKAFYRTKPALANLCNLFLEAASFALSVGFIVMRVVKLVFAAGLFIGRIDRPFLAPGVGNLWGYFELDAYPTIYQRDILAHEAHRHPLIELLGAMYMMKLRHGGSFAKQAGSCWRLIFVFALCPWLSKYRILTRSQQNLESNDAATLQFMSLRKVLRTSLDLHVQGRPSVVQDNGQAETEETLADEEFIQDFLESTRVLDGPEEELESPTPALSAEEENIQLRTELALLRRQMKVMNMKLTRGSLLAVDKGRGEPSQCDT